MTAPPDAYKVLQVDPEAEDEVIGAAYRRLARKYHPDVAPDAESAARMAALNAAWAQIGDPVKRAAYDRARGSSGGSPASGTGASAPTSRPTYAPSGPGASAGSAARRAEPETVSRDWSSGRSSVGGGYDPSMRTSDGTGAAGSPPGNPSGSVLTFGRYAGWSIGEIGRTDLEYLEWLDRMPVGRPYRDEIDSILRRTGRRRSAEAEASDRRGLFRRR